MKNNLSYTELIKIPTFEERFEYLKQNGNVGDPTFGAMRYLNQAFYTSDPWKKVRNEVIIRDNGCDLGIADRVIFDCVIVHHINPITIEDLLHPDKSDKLLNLNNLICVSDTTHKAIHYGDKSLLAILPKERYPGDTKLW